MAENDLEREWRGEVMRRVTSIETTMITLSGQIARFDHATVVDHEHRLRVIELAWAKALGILIAAQVIAGVLWGIFVYATKDAHVAQYQPRPSATDTAR